MRFRTTDETSNQSFQSPVQKSEFCFRHYSVFRSYLEVQSQFLSCPLVQALETYLNIFSIYGFPSDYLPVEILSSVSLSTSSGVKIVAEKYLKSCSMIITYLGLYPQFQHHRGLHYFPLKIFNLCFILIYFTWF